MFIQKELQRSHQRIWNTQEKWAEVSSFLAQARNWGDEFLLRTCSTFLVGQENPLYGVKGVFNSIFVHGNMLGDAMFYGSGAGKLPTASAVVADVVEAAKHLHDTIQITGAMKR